MTERDIFTAAREITDPTARAAFLDRVCAADAALRKRVEALLAAHDRPDSLLDVPAVAPPDPARGPTRAYRPAEAGDGATRRHGDADDDTGDALGFLAPSARPDSLGRLAHYEVLEVLGKGGFGVVFRAFDDVLQRVVAVKVLAPSLAATSPARKRFDREARAAAAISHENVVPIHEVGQQPLPYLVMQFIPGETLQRRLDRTGPLDVPEVLRIGRQVAEGLAAAHANDLVHRDIKPSNILIEGGPQQRVKITDFGLARAADDASISHSGIVAGTPMYMAPEQARGESLDHRADLFSLGSVLYVMCSGRPPFRANSTLAVLKRVAEEQPRPIREIIPEVPEWLCRIVEKLHAKDPADRYQSAREVADVLADCERQLQSHRELRDYSRIPGGEPTTPRWTLPRPVVVAAALLLPATAVILFLLDEGGSVRTRPLSALVGVLVSVVAVGASQYLGRPDAAATPAARWLSQVPVWAVLVCAAASTLAAAFVLGLPDLDDVGPFLVAPPLAAALFSLIPARLFAGRGATAASLPRRARRPVARRPRSPVMLVVLLLVGIFGVGLVGLAAAGVAFWFVMPVHDEFRQNPVPSWSGGEPIGPAPEVDGWVQLFNGMDLTGWTHSAQSRAVWRVEGGSLVGRGGQGYLLSAKAYDNFHLRAEVKINKAGNSGIAFRRRLQAEIRNDAICPTGTILEIGPKTTPLVHHPQLPIPEDEWFTFEIRAQAQSLAVRINGGQWINGHDVRPDGSRAGPLELEVGGPETVVHFRKIEVKELTPSPPADDWVELFNSRDLTGWKAFPDDTAGTWTVTADGYLQGKLPEGKEASELVWTGGTYRDFHLRAEVRIGDGDIGGILFRWDYPKRDPGGNPEAYDAVINSNSPVKTRTGSLSHLGRDKAIKDRLVMPNVWFTYEVIARGDEIELRVNGNTTVKHTDPQRLFRGGHLALELSTPGGVIQFRKVEVRSPPTPAPADDWVKLFNGKDLAGWGGKFPEAWGVEGGVLVGRGKKGSAEGWSELISARDDYRDFHLRAEAKMSAAGWASVRVRKPKGAYSGYKVWLSNDPANTGATTGRLDVDGGAEFKLTNPPDDLKLKPDEWFTLELVARGPELTVLINGKEVTRVTDSSFARGEIQLEVAGADAVIQFRKIEIKEMPLLPLAAPPDVLEALNGVIAAKQKSRDIVKARAEAGVSSKADLIAAEIELIEARIKLAEAERDPGIVARLLEELVTQCQEQRRLIGLRVEVGAAAADELNQADARLADAKVRLAKARSELPSPVPVAPKR